MKICSNNPLPFLSVTVIDLHSRLQLPWYEYIPIMYSAFSLYLRKIENKKEVNKVLKQTSEVMACMAFLSKTGNLIINTASFYDKQIKEIEKILRKEEQ